MKVLRICGKTRKELFAVFERLGWWYDEYVECAISNNDKLYHFYYHAELGHWVIRRGRMGQNLCESPTRS